MFDAEALRIKLADINKPYSKNIDSAIYKTLQSPLIKTVYGHHAYHIEIYHRASAIRNAIVSSISTQIITEVRLGDLSLDARILANRQRNRNFWMDYAQDHHASLR